MDALGSNGIDYVRFLLAIWLDQRNEDAQADIFLQAIPEPALLSPLWTCSIGPDLSRDKNPTRKLNACITVDNN